MRAPAGDEGDGEGLGDGLSLGDGHGAEVGSSLGSEEGSLLGGEGASLGDGDGDSHAAGTPFAWPVRNRWAGAAFAAAPNITTTVAPNMIQRVSFTRSSCRLSFVFTQTSRQAHNALQGALRRR